jgi:sulfur-carrier protein
MQIIVNIPTILRPFTNDQKRIEAVGSNVLEILDHIEAQYPGVKDKIIEEGKPRRYINIYVKDDDIRFRDGLLTSLLDGDSITILPSVAGGCV